jgi:hypothetical protein
MQDQRSRRSQGVAPPRRGPINDLGTPRGPSLKALAPLLLATSLFLPATARADEHQAALTWAQKVQCLGALAGVVDKVVPVDPADRDSSDRARDQVLTKLGAASSAVIRLTTI